MRWLRRIALGLAALLLVAGLAGLGLLLRLSSRLEAESRVVETARGPIEYASVGEGPAVLLIHGSPGGYDQMLPLARRLAERGFRSISVSRPGYLRTPLAVGGHPAEQAEAMGALLDALGIESVAVVGLSGGGPVSLHLAHRLPERVRALALIAAMSGPPAAEGGSPEESLANFGPIWNSAAVLAATFPGLGLRLLGVGDGRERERMSADAAVVDASGYLFQSLGFSWRRRGYRGDVLALFGDRAVPPLEEVRVPTLGLYAELDESVPLENGRRLAERIPGARLEVLAGEGHPFFVLRQDWLLAHLVLFLRQTSVAPG